MKNSKRIIGAATLVVSLGFVAMPAMAASATSGSCIKTADQVRSALKQNQHSQNYDSAEKLQQAGLQFCNAGMYRIGMARYSAALKLLGAGKAAGTTANDNS